MSSSFWQEEGNAAFQVGVARTTPFSLFPDDMSLFDTDVHHFFTSLDTSELDWIQAERDYRAFENHVFIVQLHNYTCTFLKVLVVLAMDWFAYFSIIELTSSN